jgi:hypothetical protein
MELWQLKYFLAVADELNYGRAAARLNVALQPPVHLELAIARLKNARPDAALERFVEAARGATRAEDPKLAVAPLARDEAAARRGRSRG